MLFAVELDRVDKGSIAGGRRGRKFDFPAAVFYTFDRGLAGNMSFRSGLRPLGGRGLDREADFEILGRAVRFIRHLLEGLPLVDQFDQPVLLLFEDACTGVREVLLEEDVEVLDPGLD